ncbi:MAG: hypothetical protein GY722_09580 [bacterium]|nr:hypothetical protein [bacterium]
MATDKRERQRENRAVKQAAVNKHKRREKLIGRMKRYSVWVVVFALLIIFSQIVWG